MGLVGIDLRASDRMKFYCTDAQRDAARRMVGLNALDPEDELQLLEMLDLVERDAHPI